MVATATIHESSTVRLEVTRRAELAVRAMAALGSAEGRMKAPALAGSLGTTVGFVNQVVAPLVRAGWVRSEPGPLGGYSVTVELREVSVLDVIEAVDGTTASGRCVAMDRPCGEGICILHEAWTQARAVLTEHLQGTSLADVAAARS